ncbi:MAG: tRNA (adenosine(37)-N6)-dimethylallyltransferase MiaA [Vicinamibacteria bacterium]
MAAPLIALVGPTAAGKSAVALRLARELSGEIVSCDSLQVYRGLDIGSAKATAAERAEVPHHLLDVVDPDALFSAAEYARLARAAVADIAGRGRVPIVAGGTGLYLRALVFGLFEGPPRDAAFRARLAAFAARRGAERMHRLLARVDPESAARLSPADEIRVVRALEVFRATGRPLTAHHRGGAAALEGFRVHVVGIAPPREALRAAVVRRTDEMFARGLVAEVRGLLERGYAPDLRPLQAIGYRQAVEVALGRGDEAAARRDIVAATMQYAKRQLTWFRHQTDASWSETPDGAFAAALAAQR